MNWVEKSIRVPGFPEARIVRESKWKSFIDEEKPRYRTWYAKAFGIYPRMFVHYNTNRVQDELDVVWVRADVFQDMVEGERYALDLWAHEMGHCLGYEHSPFWRLDVMAFTGLFRCRQEPEELVGLAVQYHASLIEEMREG